MSDDSSPDTLSSEEDDETDTEVLPTDLVGDAVARSASRRRVKLPEQKKRKSATKSPLLLLTAGPPFVPKPKALATNLSDYKKAVSAYYKADLKIQSAETDTEASLAKSECAAVLHKIKYIESDVKSGQFKHFDPVKSKSDSAKLVANRKKRSK